MGASVSVPQKPSSDDIAKFYNIISDKFADQKTLYTDKLLLAVKDLLDQLRNDIKGNINIYNASLRESQKRRDKDDAIVREDLTDDIIKFNSKFLVFLNNIDINVVKTNLDSKSIIGSASVESTDNFSTMIEGKKLRNPGPNEDPTNVIPEYCKLEEDLVIQYENACKFVKKLVLNFIKEVMDGLLELEAIHNNIVLANKDSVEKISLNNNDRINENQKTLSTLKYTLVQFKDNFERIYVKALIEIQIVKVQCVVELENNGWWKKKD